MRDNPTKRHLEALAGFFGVPPAYFFDSAEAERIDAELALLTALRDAPVRQIAMRANGLSAKSLEAIADMVDRVRELEGLSPSPPATRHLRALSRRRLHRRCLARLRDLPLPEPFDVRALCEQVAERRGRPMRLMPIAGLTGVCGLWIATDTTDLICYEQRHHAPAPGPHHPARAGPRALRPLPASLPRTSRPRRCCPTSTRRWCGGARPRRLLDRRGAGGRDAGVADPAARHDPRRRDAPRPAARRPGRRPWVSCSACTGRRCWRGSCSWPAGPAMTAPAATCGASCSGWRSPLTALTPRATPRSTGSPVHRPAQAHRARGHAARRVGGAGSAAAPERNAHARPLAHVVVRRRVLRDVRVLRAHPEPAARSRRGCSSTSSPTSSRRRPRSPT